MKIIRSAEIKNVRVTTVFIMDLLILLFLTRTEKEEKRKASRALKQYLRQQECWFHVRL